MAPRDPSLPEGTDHIIDTNIDLGDTGGGSGGGAGGLGGGTGGGTTGSGGGGTTGSGGSGATGGAGATTGTGGSGGGSAFQFDKSGGGSSGSGGGNSRTSGIAGQVKDQINTLKSQAGDRARSLADDGKSQATSFLQTIAEVVADAAGSVEERLGGQYAGFGHKASTSINSLASTLDERSVDDLLEDARSFVHRSPAVAIGVAALLGFAVARVVRSGVSEYSGTGQSDTGTTGGGTAGAIGGTGATGGTRGGASGGLDATSGGFGEQGVGTAGTMGSSGVSTGAGSSGGTGNAPTI
jgi:ElaB/YqjD/DUF883 family membrane-anchored ribosome-binding protein